MEIKITDNSGMVLGEFKAACLRGLERCGSQGEGYAKDLAPSPGKTGTGELRNEISHKVDEAELAVYIGTNNDHAIYQELGTGEYYPGGRPTPWVYQDAKGNWHWTRGNPAQPFIKPAVADHAKTFQRIIGDELKNG